MTARTIAAICAPAALMSALPLRAQQATTPPILRCCSAANYDPMTGKYGLVVMNGVRAAGGL